MSAYLCIYYDVFLGISMRGWCHGRSHLFNSMNHITHDCVCVFVSFLSNPFFGGCQLGISIYLYTWFICHPFCHLLCSAGNKVVVFWQPLPQDYKYIYLSLLFRLDTEHVLSENLKMGFFKCNSDDKLALLFHLLQHVITDREQTVIFAATKHHVEYLHLVSSSWETNIGYQRQMTVSLVSYIFYVCNQKIDYWDIVCGWQLTIIENNWLIDCGSIMKQKTSSKGKYSRAPFCMRIRWMNAVVLTEHNNLCEKFIWWSLVSDFWSCNYSK